MINPMNTRSNKELLFGHSLLHSWAKGGYKNKPKNWTKTQIRNEHARLVKIMKKRGIEHNSPIP